MDHGELDLGKTEEEEGHLYLPPGFRFHPTDEELITYYLSKKVMDPSGFTAKAMGDVDLNKCEPWDLPWKAKMGEEEWYFFCVRDRKYPTGLRTNRATEAGYWKATGKDKEIYRGKSLVGMKKTLVFYKGRAPKGEKTSWVMHEYRLEEKNSVFNHSKSPNREWVISRVFNKSACVKKPIGSSLLPPLMDVPSTSKNMAHVTCFSNAMERQKGHDDILAEYYNYSTPFLISVSAAAAAATKTSVVSPSSLVLGKMPLQNTFYGASSMGHTPASLVQLLQSSNGYTMNQSRKMEREMLSVSQDTGITSDINPEISSVVSNNEMGRHSFDRQDPSPSAGQLQLDHALWNY